MKKIYLLATLVAIITGITVYMFATQLQKNSQPQVVQYEMVSVVTAVADIPSNTQLTAEMLTTVEIPKESVPDGVVKNIEYLVGKTTKYPVSKGEQLFYDKVTEIGDATNDILSDRIKEGYRAFTIAVDDVSGLAGYLRVGDRIDIMVTKTVGETVTTSYVLQNIPIIAIGNASQYVNGVTQISSYSSITLEIQASDCAMLNYNLTQGKIKIILRGYGDNDIKDASDYSEQTSES